MLQLKAAILNLTDEPARPRADHTHGVWGRLTPLDNGFTLCSLAKRCGMNDVQIAG
jgi:hypothetical protein